ncbi:TPA: hypothetical protein QC448_002846 [Bacillus cereus]|uniref:hypothetical protein n=2 Tax=Bacillus thuringiensis TaxID=1428 RepID=UPI000BF5BAD7|nr:hypothetical protein [Bacillus thuringiensis]HDR8127637.1 hypothetical protein [Bacillus cereus]PEW47907.1 hypothetical protein CN444_09875 [Bacillus thuringiensis]PEY70008.1 hypothetical protein CN352_02785 [Bacillus thuringiensis]PGH68800.1 hypothetical protein CN894_21655 [Bacillus thuringiensis]HDR8491804.1 hypothetical protein [Bacillus cereus]
MNGKWVKENPDFFKKNKIESLINLKGNSDLKEEFSKYSIMFKESAHLITEHIFEKPNIGKLDTYFFSLAYLYRHSLELILKAIGFKYILDIGSRRDFIKETFHNLASLLEAVNPYIKDNVIRNCEAFQWIEAFFEDINDIDKESDSFRYPFGITMERNPFDNKKKFGIKSFFEEQTHINLFAFANKMEIAFEILESYLHEKDIKDELFKGYKPVFFEEGGGYYYQSVIGHSYSRDKFYPYVKAYTESAEYLYDCMSKDRKLNWLLFIPMCYLYRNAIELAMKEILFEECSYSFQESVKLMNDKKHSILGLWNSIKVDIIKHAQAPEEDTTLANVQKYINQLHNIDGQADKFRYPTDKFMNLHFKTSKKLDIENIVNYFGELAAFLSGVCAMVSAQNEWLAEMEAEYRADMESH